MPLREVSTDTFLWSPSVRIYANQITAVHPQLILRCLQWRGICRSKTSGKPILTICPMSSATSSTRSVIITKSLCPRISRACSASCTLMTPSSPTLELPGREHSNCMSWAQRRAEPKVTPLGNYVFGLFVRRMGRSNGTVRRIRTGWLPGRVPRSASGAGPTGSSPGPNPGSRGRIRTDLHCGPHATRAPNETPGRSSLALDRSSLWISLASRSAPGPRGGADRADRRGDGPRIVCPLSRGRWDLARAGQGLAPARYEVAARASSLEYGLPPRAPIEPRVYRQTLCRSDPCSPCAYPALRHASAWPTGP